MILYKLGKDISAGLDRLKKQGNRIGFVPTMGALHNGHMQLIKQCLNAGNTTVVSIFVNPTQFNDKKDFEKYPVTIEQDIKMLNNVGADILFLPAVEEVYPEGLDTIPRYDLGHLESILEGKYRPGHFQGVCNVMHRLLKKLQPHNLYMGQKDYQQCMVIQKLINDNQLTTKLHVVPTIREESGLAMSSRNMHLSPDAKEQASAIFKAHSFIKNNLLKLSFTELKHAAAQQLKQAGFTDIDYIEISDAGSLTPATTYKKDQKLVALTAAFINGVRLIDNMLLN